MKNTILWPGFTRDSPLPQGTVGPLASIVSMLVAIVEECDDVIDVLGDGEVLADAIPMLWETAASLAR